MCASFRKTAKIRSLIDSLDFSPVDVLYASSEPDCIQLQNIWALICVITEKWCSCGLLKLFNPLKIKLYSILIFTLISQS